MGLPAAVCSEILTETALLRSIATAAQKVESLTVNDSPEPMLPAHVKINVQGRAMHFSASTNSWDLELLLNVVSGSEPTKTYCFPAMACRVGGSKSEGQNLSSSYFFIVLPGCVPAQTLLPETEPRSCNAHSKNPPGVAPVHSLSAKTNLRSIAVTRGESCKTVSSGTGCRSSRIVSNMA